MRRVLAISIVVNVSAVAAATGWGAAGDPLERSGLRELHPSISLDLRYATDDNFTGRRLPGYCDARAYLLPRAALALRRADRRLRRRGYALVVHDAYRPARATRAMVRWASRTGNDHLLDGWIARRSNHNSGAAVDVGLARAADGRLLWMGTRYDSFSPRSGTHAVRGRALGRRLRLAAALRREGFRPYGREWWHFDWPGAGPRLDVAISC